MNGPSDALDALDALVRRYSLEAAAGQRLSRLLEALERDPHAPTTVRSPSAAVNVHIADCLVALELEAVRSASVAADVGSGPGFPGLALAAALPRMSMTLIESVGRKCRFLSRARDVAGIVNADVVGLRVEEWSEGSAVCDLVTARAVAPLPVLVEYAAPLLRLGGALVAWKGRRDPDEEAAGSAAAAIVGLHAVEVRAVQPYSTSRHRHLHLYRKVTDTPPDFPRRAGMAHKRPLSAGRHTELT